MLGLIVVASLLSAAGVLFTASFSGRRASVPASTALVLRLDGDLGEVEGSGLFDRFVAGPPTVRALIDAIGRAKTDRRVKGLVLEPVGGAPFWARSQEIRDAILDFRKSGKKTVAFLEYGGEQEYFLATACEKVFLLPTSVLDLKGLATYEVFLRGTFDKIGVSPDFLHIGDYKTAINTFTEKTFTPAHREMTESLNRDTFDQLVQAIAVARKKTPETVRALIDEGPFIAEDALAAGLVDDLLVSRRGRRAGRAGRRGHDRLRRLRARPATALQPQRAAEDRGDLRGRDDRVAARARAATSPARTRSSTTSTRRPTITPSRRSCCASTARAGRRSPRT